MKRFILILAFLFCSYSMVFADGAQFIGGDGGGTGGTPAPAETYTRPADWLTLPAVIATEQVFYGLHAVFDSDANFCTVQATGNYTVDWGDGSAAENIASGVTAYHNFVYSDLALETYCSRGYRQAIVSIVPQDGQTLTNVNLSLKHNQEDLSNKGSQWLDIAVAMNNIGTVAMYNTGWIHRLLEQFTWYGTNTQTSFASMFYNCISLQSIPLLNTAAGTSFASMFYNCYSLQSIPLLNTAAGTSFTSMFYNCYSLQSIPLLNTAAGTSFASMFYNCVSLQSIPALNTAAGTDFANMFYYCSSLQRNKMTGCIYSISYDGCALSAAALNEIYTNLGTVTGQTITVTGNFGITGDDPSIATAKGWTVTG